MYVCMYDRKPVDTNSRWSFAKTMTLYVIFLSFFVPARSLPYCTADFVPCDRLLQNAYFVAVTPELRELR